MEKHGMTASNVQETPGAKMVYLIKRKPTTTREELIAHWFANHMPGVIEKNSQKRDAGEPHATHYTATLFDPEPDKSHDWDGMAHLWYAEPLRRPAQASAVTPYDTFQEKVEPYWPWATREYIVMDGALPLNPSSLNAPFPCTRSGFFKVTFLVAMQQSADRDALFNHWLDVHVPNVQQTMEAVGGFRYAVSHSLAPETEPFAGIAELYFQDASGWAAYRERIQPDGMAEWVDYDAMQIFCSRTEMVGIE
jgi:hypothetical protein